jgi:hypothetical protein
MVEKFWFTDDDEIACPEEKVFGGLSAIKAGEKPIVNTQQIHLKSLITPPVDRKFIYNSTILNRVQPL